MNQNKDSKWKITSSILILRNHLLSIGNPILGDQEYGIDLLILKGKGLYLHASQLEFTHPFSGKKLSIKSTIPIKFKKIIP